ncbi:MAG: hypothetical protein E6K81_14085 [Candidatus Eisenbacteria bacterium]|uniref:Uncharacterized protein n=1 Tax=Eiseniibacteriota bacterium TaxID=2212470 RepID=A0A538U1M4_UNCEI|nr:MAG: hypothetical protein E6K81_14085 [Candidatus Eisenbacteria bacterium]
MPRLPASPAASGRGRRPPRTRPWLTRDAAPGIGVGEARVERLVAWALAGVLAIMLLAVALGPHRIGDYSTETDFYGAYADGARLIQHGHLDATRYGVIGPVYEVTLALAGLVVRDLFLAAELISVLGTRLALLAALFLATNPYFVRYGYTASTDALALALQAAALALLLGCMGRRAAAAAGLVAALAFLTRYSAITLLPVGLLAAACGGRPAGPGTSRRAEKLAFAAGFAALVLPWLGFSLAHGAGVGASLHHNLAYEVFARALEPQFKSLWDVIARDPAAVARQMAINVAAHLRDDARILLGPPFAAAALLGGLLAGATGALRRGWPLATAALLGFLAFVPVFYSERYSLALLPFYAVAAAYLFAAPRWALVLGGRVPLKPLLAVIPLALGVLGSWDLQRRVLAQQPVEASACAERLRALARPGDRVIARKPHIAWLAGVGAVPFPFVDRLDSLAAYARAHQARWLFYALPEGESRQGFRYLLDTSAVVPGLTVRQVSGPRPAVLYDTLVALHDARAAALSYPRDARAQRVAGTIELALGQLAAARVHLERAADLAPSDVEALLPLGETLLRLGELRLAGLAYARAETVSPGNVSARVGRGWVSLASGRPQEAAELWRPVIGATTNPATLARMVELYERLGDREAAAAARARLGR